MLQDRFRLTDGGLLRRLMTCPDKGGRRHTVRSLADAAGVSKSTIQDIIHGRLNTDETTATRIAAAVGGRRQWLFFPASFTFANEYERSNEDAHDPGATLQASAARRVHELEQHDRPARQDGEGNEVEPLDPARERDPG